MSRAQRFGPAALAGGRPMTLVPSTAASAVYHDALTTARGFRSLCFFLLLLILQAVFRHPGAGKQVRWMGGAFAFRLIFVALSPRLTLGAAATPGDAARYLAIVGGGLLLLALIFGRSDLE